MIKMRNGKRCESFDDYVTLVNNEALADAQDACDDMFVFFSDFTEARGALEADQGNNQKQEEARAAQQKFFRANGHAIKHVERALKVLRVLHGRGVFHGIVKPCEPKRKKKDRPERKEASQPSRVESIWRTRFNA